MKKNFTPKIKSVGRQAIEVGRQLDKLRQNVTPTDRAAIVEAFKMSRPTLSRYLHGHCANVDTGLKLVLFITEKIGERDKILQEL